MNTPRYFLCGENEMPYVIKFIGCINGESSRYDGKYLKSYNARYIRPDGTYDGGNLKTTPRLEEAQKFDTVVNALNKWKETAPYPWNIRYWDRKPNRPLTAYTIEVESI